MIRYYCDRCHKEIASDEDANVFRMWNLTRADALGIYDLASIACDQDFLICDECFDKMSDFMEKDSRAERTCHVEETYHDELWDAVCTLLSCGHEAWECTPKYCPECGAKVVTQS